MPSGQIVSEGEEVKISNTEVPQAADIVFVVSHKECNKDAVTKITNIVSQMERSLKSEGLKDNRYGLVGYGGKGILSKPHIYTVNGQVFAAKNKFGDFLENFFITESGSEDALDALRYAATYPFRAGVSKSIILVPCESCNEASVTYPEMQQLLFSRDIHLHLLLHHKFQLRTSSTKTSYIFGVDRKGLFTPKHVNDKKLTGDEDLRKQVLMPKDLCAALSEETDGSIFSMTQLIEARRFVQKRFIDVMTRLTAKKASPTDCQICECVSDEIGVGLSICHNCISSEPIFKVYIFSFNPSPNYK